MLLPEDILAKLELTGHQEQVSRAVVDRDRIWQRYLKHFTTVKEAPGQDARTIQYEIGLDLNPFCRYARRVEDLKSR